jgi:hypothetical protein
MTSNLIGQIFGRLTVIQKTTPLKYPSGTKGQWICKCVCGKLLTVPTCRLKSGNTKSCGCLHLDTSKENIKKANSVNIKYEPRIFTAREVWYSFYNKDGILFEDFFKLSQMTCFYCSSEPDTKTNRFLNSKFKNSYLINKEDGEFIYNGLDRVNSSKQHTINNVVTCCPTCNRIKSDKNILDFIKYVDKLPYKNSRLDKVLYQKSSENILMIDLNQKFTGSSIKSTFSDHYKCAGLTVEQFYKMSQLNCYYCNSPPSNATNKNKSSSLKFIYNGLDRINNNDDHSFENIISCCYTCNFGKSNIEFENFINHLEKLKNNYLNLTNKVLKWVV